MEVPQVVSGFLYTIGHPECMEVGLDIIIDFSMVGCTPRKELPGHPRFLDRSIAKEQHMAIRVRAITFSGDELCIHPALIHPALIHPPRDQRPEHGVHQ